MAICCPERLDPVGWEAGEALTVQRHVERMTDISERTREALRLRFGSGSAQASACLLPHEVARRLRMPTAHVVQSAQQMLSALPLVAEEGPLEVLYEDEELVAVAKPAGTPSHPASRLRGGSLLNRLAFRLGREPRLLHRLDLGTSGVLLFGASYQAASTVQQAFQNGAVRKTYLAICRGGGGAAVPAMGAPLNEQQRLQLRNGKQFTIAAPILQPDPADIKRVVREGGKRSVTQAQLLARGAWRHAGDQGARLVEEAPEPASFLVQAQPLTGRTHQIRLHLAHVGLPLLGDSLYGVPCELINRHALHAYQLTLPHPRSGKPLTVTAPLPKDMRELAEQLSLQLPESIAGGPVV